MVTAAVARLRWLLTDGSEVTAPAPRWRPWVALLLSAAGLGISTYLTIDHFAKIRLVCAESGVVNCQKVTTSAQSHFLGMPVAVLGLAFYVVMTALNLPAAWRAADRRVHLARLVLSLLGIAFVLYLVAAELLIIGSICLWCTSVHVVTFLLLVLLVATVPTMLGWGAAAAAPAPTRPRGQGRSPGSGRQGRAPKPPASPASPRKGQGRQKGQPKAKASAGRPQTAAGSRRGGR